MADDLAATLVELRAAVAALDYAGIEDGIRWLESFTDDDGTWGGELFEAVKSLLADEAFLNTGQSHLLVFTLRLDWDFLSSRQHDELRPLMTAAFDRFGDWLGTQLVAELLAEHYADDTTFAALDRLSREAATRPARGLAAYGIGQLARALERGPLYDRAVEALNRLIESGDEYVVDEAQDALWRLPKPDAGLTDS